VLLSKRRFQEGKMKNEVRRNALKIGLPFLVIMTLVMGMALPVLADNTSKPNSGLRVVQGEVMSISSDNSTSDNATIVIQNGNQLQVTIKVDANTKYFMVPNGKATVAADNGIAKYKVAEKKANNGQSKNIRVTEQLEAGVTANCENDPNLLGRFGKEAQFSDIQVGDRVIARVRTADNLATQVLIIKAPAIQKVKGTITAVSDNSITITPANGAAVTLTWDGNTRFVLKGLISVQSGQYAAAVYNRTTMKAQTVDVQVTAPSSGISD
jgi:hypothetical protein